MLIAKSPINSATIAKHQAVIGLGSNLGDRAAYLLRAITALIAAGIRLVNLSSIYETEPVDYLDQPSFLNMIAIAADPLPDPQDLLSICLKIEADLGRDREITKGPRVIDLDLLIYDDLISEDRSDLILPHPRLHNRRFVLMPLAELLPHALHPKLKISYTQLLSELRLPGKVFRYRS
ncbi:MAG: 2-amino-4-hydroxy-6-hydroxymethyldihydropteridine diphosphokinase [Acidobacteriota bacterium]